MVPLVMSLIPIPIFDEGCLLRLSQSIDEAAESITDLPLSLATPLPKTVVVFLPGRNTYLSVRRVFVEEAVSDPCFITAQRLGAQLLQRLFERLLLRNNTVNAADSKGKETQLIIDKAVKRVSKVHNCTTEFLNRAIGKYLPNVKESFRYVHPKWDGFVPYPIQAKIIETWGSDAPHASFDNDFFYQKLLPEVESLIRFHQLEKIEKVILHSYNVIRASVEPHNYYDSFFIFKRRIESLLLKNNVTQDSKARIEELLKCILSVTRTLNISSRDFDTHTSHQSLDYVPKNLTLQLLPKRAPDSSIEETSLQEIASTYFHLKSVSITADSHYEEEIQENAYDIRSLLLKLRFLEELRLTYVCSPSILNQISFSRLNELCLICNERNGDHYLNAQLLMSSSFPRLKKIWLRTATKPALCQLLQGIFHAAPVVESVVAITSRNGVATPVYVSGDTLDKIEKLPYLSSLSIVNCPVARRFVTELISKAPVLQKLKLLAEFEDRGKISIFNSKIHKLCLNDLYTPDCTFALSSIRTLVLRSLKPVQPRNSTLALSNSTQITKLVVQNLEVSEKSDYSYLHFPAVIKALFESITLTNEGYIERLPEMPQLKELHIGWNVNGFNIPNVRLAQQALSNFPELTRLTIGILTHNTTVNEPQLLERVVSLRCTTYEYITENGYVVEILSNFLVPKLQSLSVAFQYSDESGETENSGPLYVSWGDNQAFQELYELSICSFSNVKVLSYIETYLSSLNAPSLRKIDLSELLVEDFDSDYIWSVARRYFPEIECIVFPLRD